MPDVVVLKARVEFDTRSLEAGAKKATSVVNEVGSNAASAGAAVKGLGTATDAAGASADKASGSIKTETAALKEAKTSAEGASAGALSLSKANEAAASSASAAASAHKALSASLSPSTLWGPSTAAAKAHAAKVAEETAAAEKAAVALKAQAEAEAEAATQAAAASKRSHEFAVDLAAVAWKSKDAGGGIKDLSDRLKTIDTAPLEKVGRTLTIGVTAPIIAAGVASIKAASDLTETMGKSEIVFGKNAAAVKAWAQTSTTEMGLSEQAAIENAASFGNLFVAMGFGSEKAAEMSTALTKLGSDLGALNNKGTQEGIDALRSGLVGETEPLRRFGVTIDEARIKSEALRLGLVTTTKDGLDPQVKTLAIYSLAMQQTATAHDNFRLTNGEMSGSLKVAGAELENLSAKFGKELKPVVTDALKEGTKLLKWFNSWPESTRKNTLAIVGVTATLGPFALGLANVVNAGKGIAGLVGNVGKLGALKGLGGVLGIGGRAAAATPALSEFAGIGGTVAAAGGVGAGTIGAALAGGAAATTGGVFAARELDKHGWLGKLGGNLVESAFGGIINPVGIARHWEGIQKVLGWDKKPSVTAASSAPAKANVPAASPTVSTVLTDEDRAKFERAADAEFAAKVDAAKSSVRVGDESTKAQREAAALLPLLASRREALAKEAKSLEPKIKTDADAAVAYWRSQKEQSNLLDQGEELKQRAAKEAADNQKKAADKAKQAQREQFALRNQQLDNFVLAARAQQAWKGEGEDGDSNKAAIRERDLMNPVLTAKQQALIAQWRGLVATGKQDPETAKELGQLQADYNNLEIEKARNATAAARAEKNLQKKAGEEATKAFQARTQIARDQAVAKASEALPGQEQRALLRELGPVLQEEQDALLADLQNYKVGSEDYWKALGQVEKSKREAAKLQQSAAKEAVAEQKKAADDAKKASRERLQLMGAEIRLAELQLKNDPRLTERQRKFVGNNLLAQQYAAAKQASPGESRMERINRELEAEQIKGTILDNIKAMGGGRRNQWIASRQLDFLARQNAGSPTQAQQLAESQRAAKAAEAKAPGTLVVQVFSRDDSPASIAREVARVQQQQRRDSGLLVPVR